MFVRANLDFIQELAHWLRYIKSEFHVLQLRSTSTFFVKAMRKWRRCIAGTGATAQLITPVISPELCIRIIPKNKKVILVEITVLQAFLIRHKKACVFGG